MLTVGFLGNCQAQALETWATQADDRLEIVTFPPIWLIEQNNVDNIIQSIERCDVLFAQRLSDDFELTNLATSRLKARYGEKVVSWPNAYFDGYFPGLSYRYCPGGKILGPLDEYHWDPIEASFLQGRSVADCVELMETDAIFSWFPDPVAGSLSRLGERESGLDIVISDYLATELHLSRLFYSMNHPTIPVLRELIDRMFGEIGERDRLGGLSDYSFPLDKIILPVLPAIAARHKITFLRAEPTKGVVVEFEEKSYHVTDRAHLYSMTDLVECFYRVYEANGLANGN